MAGKLQPRNWPPAALAPTDTLLRTLPIRLAMLQGHVERLLLQARDKGHSTLTPRDYKLLQGDMAAIAATPVEPSGARFYTVGSHQQKACECPWCDIRETTIHVPASADEIADYGGGYRISIHRVRAGIYHSATTSDGVVIGFATITVSVDWSTVVLDFRP